MKKNILLSSVAALSLLSVASNAQELNDVNIWETQVVASSVNLSNDSIETKQADHLSDLLRDIPGVDVGGTHSINNRINIRGLQDEDLDITLDGAKVQNANMFHHIGNLLINPDILKKASIQVGTNSVVSGSLGGSLAFETKDGKDMLENGKQFGARLSTTYNSNSSMGGSVSVYGKVLEQASFLLYHNYINKNNWKDGVNNNTFGIEGKTSNTLAKISYNINDNQSLSFSYDTLRDEGDYLPRPDSGKEYNISRTGMAVFPTKYKRETLTLKHKLNLNDSLILNTSLYSNENNLVRTESWTGTSPRPDANGTIDGKVKTQGININALSNFETKEVLHSLTYGLLYDKQTSEVTWNNSNYGDKEEAISASIFLQNALDFNNGLVLTPGLKYNHYDFDGSYGKIKDNKFTYALAAEYDVTDELTLLASVTSLYKGVQMVDVLASNRTVTQNNENLQAETGINTEVGFKYITQNILNADTVGFSFKYFNTKIKDHIETVWSSAPPFIANMENTGDLELKGFEASLAYNKDAFNSLFTYSHSKSVFKKTKEPLEKEPGDSFSATLSYDIQNNLKVSWNSLFVFTEDKVKTPTSRTNYDVKAAYNVHNLAVNWKSQTYKNLSIIAGIDNIFNKDYTSHTSTYTSSPSSSGKSHDVEPGRNIKITLAYKF